MFREGAQEKWSQQGWERWLEIRGTKVNYWEIEKRDIDLLERLISCFRERQRNRSVKTRVGLD